MTVQYMDRTGPNTFRLTCQHCRRRKNLQIDALRDPERPLRVQCRCGRDFRVVHDRRYFARRAVDLVGYLSDPTTKTLRDTITIIDVSLGGVGFVTQEILAQVGETFTIGFFLDDASRAWIEDIVVVKTVQHESVVGAAFLDPTAYNFDLDFYLSAFTVVE